MLKEEESKLLIAQSIFVLTRGAFPTIAATGRPRANLATGDWRRGALK